MEEPAHRGCSRDSSRARSLRVVPRPDPKYTDLATHIRPEWISVYEMVAISIYTRHPANGEELNMTIMAGVCSRSNEQIPFHLRDQIKNHLSRYEEDKPIEVSNERVWIAKVDIGAFGSPGVYVDPNGGFSLLTGEPLIGDSARERDLDLKTLHNDWIRGDWGSTKRTRGAFCLASYSPDNQELRLITDRLGLRGFYYIVCDGFVVFATAFRILQALTGIRKTVDLAAVAETGTFGMPLANRTILVEVKRLSAAETVVIDPKYVRRFCYWSWDSIKPSSTTGLVERLHEIFMTAISIRRKHDQTTFSFLSGGLDTRSIVGGLCRQGVTVRTVNLSRPQTQDRVLGRQFAEAMGVHHIECEPCLGGFGWQSVASGVAALRRSIKCADARPPERPLLIWNGEGGSVGFGHVHLTQAIIDLARRGDHATLAEEFRSYNYWSPHHWHILRRGWSEYLHAEVDQRFRDEMCRPKPSDPGRVPYFFLLFNDQQRKLDALQENADLIRAEMLTPFFDIEFLSEVAAANIDLFIGHKLYVEWLALLPSPVHATPWQAYPGHVPSLVPVPAGVEYQWDRPTHLTIDDRRFALRMLSKTFRPSIVPGWLIRREVALAAASVTLTGVSNYRYLLEYIDVFATAWLNNHP
jgi:asparagine synthase (glutamine-hydrolysing)